MSKDKSKAKSGAGLRVTMTRSRHGQLRNIAASVAGLGLRRIGQSVLGKVLGIARSGAMLLTDWLQSRGLVERRRRPDDGRAWGVHLTARGEKLVAAMKRRVIAEDRKRAGVLDARERRELLRLLNKLAR